MSDRNELKKTIKKAIMKLKNGSASSEEISDEFANAIEQYVRESMEKQQSVRVS